MCRVKCVSAIYQSYSAIGRLSDRCHQVMGKAYNRGASFLLGGWTMRSQRGFSLVEFVVCIAILVIFGGMAVPMMSQFVQSSKVSATASDLYVMVNLARAEAIRRNTRVTLCGLASNSQCLTQTGNGIPFETNGWAIFEDTVSGASSMLGATAPASQLIRIQPIPSGNILVRSTFNSATFTPMGQVRMNGTSLGGSVKVCKGTSSSTACDASLSVRCVVISSAGSPSVVVPTGTTAGTPAALANAGVTGSSPGCV